MALLALTSSSAFSARRTAILASYPCRWRGGGGGGGGGVMLGPQVAW